MTGTHADDTGRTIYRTAPDPRGAALQVCDLGDGDTTITITGRTGAATTAVDPADLMYSLAGETGHTVIDLRDGDHRELDAPAGELTSTGDGTYTYTPHAGQPTEMGAADLWATARAFAAAATAAERRDALIADLMPVLTRHFGDQATRRVAAQVADTITADR